MRNPFVAKAEEDALERLLDGMDRDALKRAPGFSLTIVTGGKGSQEPDEAGNAMHAMDMGDQQDDEMSGMDPRLADVIRRKRQTTMGA